MIAAVQPMHRAPAPQHPWRWGVAIVLITLAGFARLIACDFTWWDDADTIHHNPRLNPPTLASVQHYWTAAGPDAPAGLYIPATYTLWIALAAIARNSAPDAQGIWLNPHIFHAANVLLHALSAGAAFALLRRLLRQNWPAAAGALLFALHPVQVEPVAWISGTKDVLCGLLSIAALWQYVAAVDDESHQFHAGRWSLATLLLLLAILAKPTAVVAPFMAMAIDRLLLRRPWRAIWLALWPWLILCGAGAAVGRWSQAAPWSSPLPLHDRPAIAADALAFYLGKLLWPAHLCPDYGHRPAAVFASGRIYFTWIAPAALAAVLIALRRRWPVGIAAGWLFLLPLMPVLGIVGFMFQFFSTTADHYLYLAMLGPALLLGWCVMAAPRWRGGAIVALLLLLSVRTLQQEPAWQNTRTLFEHTLAVNPLSFTACDLLGFDHNQSAQQLAAMAGGAQARGEPTAANVLARQARRQLLIALDYYQQALVIDPQYVPALVSMANVHRALGQPLAAREDFHRVLLLQPLTPPAFRADELGLAAKLIEFGDAAEALPLLNQFLLQHPYSPAALHLQAAARSALAAGTSDKPASAPARH
jgi:tetratricopeptide (TPR) repeat protein